MGIFDDLIPVEPQENQQSESNAFSDLIPENSATQSTPQRHSNEELTGLDKFVRNIPFVGDSPLAKLSNEEVIDETKGLLDASASVASGIVAEPVSGLVGLDQSLNPFLNEFSGADAVDKAKKALTYTPNTEEGKRNLKTVSDKLSGVVNFIKSAEQFAGDLGDDIAGPIGGAIGATLPTALGEIVGVGIGRRGVKAADSVSDLIESTPDSKSQAAISAGDRLDVPVLTTDVAPPETFFGKLSQGIFEKLGPLGTGQKRAKQQEARQEAVKGIAEQLDIDLDTPFADDIIKSINEKTAKDFEVAGRVRNEAISSLNQFGAVPLNKTFSVIDNEIARQVRLGEKANANLVNLLQDTKKSLNQSDFSLVADIRTEVISDLKAIRRSEDTRAAASIQRVKSSIDDDLLNFAKSKDRKSASKWVNSNRKFAEGYSRVKETELKRLIKAGDATPEKILPLIKGGKPNELRRLRSSVDEKGIKSIQGAIIQEALKTSKFFDADAAPNPNAFATALSRPNQQQAIKVFFNGKSKAELDGLVTLLNSTRRAQDGNFLPRSGEQLIPVAAVAGVAVDPAIGATVVGLSSAISRAYESKRFRNALLKIRNSKKKDREHGRSIETATTMLNSFIQSEKNKDDTK